MVSKQTIRFQRYLPEDSKDLEEAIKAAGLPKGVVLTRAQAGLETSVVVGLMKGWAGGCGNAS